MSISVGCQAAQSDGCVGGVLRQGRDGRGQRRRARLCANTAIASPKARGRPASRRTSPTVDVLALRHPLQWDGGDGGTMAKPRPTIPITHADVVPTFEFTDERWQAIENEARRLPELARVPQANRSWFSDAVFELVLDVWDKEYIRRTEQDEALSRAIDSLQSARQALADLDEKYRKKHRKHFWWWQISKIETGIDRFFQEISVEPARRRAHRRGRRPGAVKNRAFQDFIHKLGRAAKSAGGRLTLQKNRETGTLIEAIHALAPHLPDGFVPKPLPVSTLQRILPTNQSGR